MKIDVFQETRDFFLLKREVGTTRATLFDVSGGLWQEEDSNHVVEWRIALGRVS